MTWYVLKGFMLYFDKTTPRQIKMKQRLFCVLMGIGILTTLNATNIIRDKTKLQALKTHNKVLQDASLEIKAAIEKPDSYLLKVIATSSGNAQLLNIILDKKSSEIYIGSAYDKKGNPIAFPKDAKAIKEGVAFSYGDKGKDIYLVTDPECPYCSKFEKDINGKLGNYRVHVILMALSFHKKAPAMIEWIMQGKDDAQRKERFEKIMLNGSTAYKVVLKDEKKPFVYSSEVEQTMKKVDKSVLELNVKGTPAIYDEYFMPVSQKQLFTHINKKPVWRSKI